MLPEISMEPMHFAWRLGIQKKQNKMLIHWHLSAQLVQLDLMELQIHLQLPCFKLKSLEIGKRTGPDSDEPAVFHF
jgi:hypothetical protein